MHDRLLLGLDPLPGEMDVSITLFQEHLCLYLYHEVKHYPVLYLGQTVVECSTSEQASTPGMWLPLLRTSESQIQKTRAYSHIFGIKIR
jgi:hypothetical protein